MTNVYLEKIAESENKEDHVRDVIRAAGGAAGGLTAGTYGVKHLPHSKTDIPLAAVMVGGTYLGNRIGDKVTDLIQKSAAEEKKDGSKMGIGKTLGYAGAGAIVGNAVGLGAISGNFKRVTKSMSNNMNKLLEKGNLDGALKVSGKYKPLINKLKAVPHATSLAGAVGAIGLGHHLNKGKD